MICRRCGCEFDAGKYRRSDGSTQCPDCKVIFRRPPLNAPQARLEQRQPSSGMVCPRCGSRNMSVQFVQVGANTLGASTGVKVSGGCLWKMIYYCCFLWLFKWMYRILFFWLPSVRMKGARVNASHTKIKNRKMMVCNNCGFSQEIKG